MLGTLGNPTQQAVTTRPDLSLKDWNARNEVPYGYVWSLGKLLHGHRGQMSNDPDAIPANPNWIYVHSTLDTGTGP